MAMEKRETQMGIAISIGAALLLLSMQQSLAQNAKQPPPQAPSKISVVIGITAIAQPGLPTEAFEEAVKEVLCGAGYDSDATGEGRIQVSAQVTEMEFGTDLQTMENVAACRVRYGEVQIAGEPTITLEDISEGWREPRSRFGGSMSPRAARAFFRGCGGTFGYRAVEALKSKSVSVPSPVCPSPFPK
jgi:hypothetical protein